MYASAISKTYDILKAAVYRHVVAETVASCSGVNGSAMSLLCTHSTQSVDASGVATMLSSSLLLTLR